MIPFAPGDSFANLSGTLTWKKSITLTDVSAQIFTGDYADYDEALPFHGDLVIGTIVEGANPSTADYSYNVLSTDTVIGDYDVHIRVVFSSGEVETISNVKRIRVRATI
jgi:hypothetical protein